MGQINSLPINTVTLTAAAIAAALGYTPANAAAVVNSFDTRVGAISLTAADIATALGYAPATSVVPSGNILVGSTGNVATAVAMSGDVTIDHTGATTVGKIGGNAVTLGGALTTSGAYAFTATLTGATGVTFPTSGTLATTAGITAAVNAALPSATTSQLYGGTGGAGVAQAVTVGTGLSLSGETLSVGASTQPSIVQAAGSVPSGGGAGTATVTFGATPTVGNRLLFFLNDTGIYSSTATHASGTIPVAPSMANGLGQASIWYRDVQSGDGKAWVFADSANQAPVIGIEVANGGAIRSAYLAPPGVGAETSRTLQAPPAQSVKGNGLALCYTNLTDETASTAVCGTPTGWTKQANCRGGNSNPWYFAYLFSYNTALASGTWVAPTVAWTSLNNDDNTGAAVATIVIDPV